MMVNPMDHISNRGIHTFEICSGAESAPGSGYDAHAKCRLLVHPLPYSVELFMAVEVDAVELFGSVERYEEDLGRRIGEDC